MTPYKSFFFLAKIRAVSRALKELKTKVNGSNIIKDCLQAGNAGNDRVVFDDSNFPSMGNAEAPAFGPGFGAAFAQRTAPRPEDFPALPGIASPIHNIPIVCCRYVLYLKT